IYDPDNVLYIPEIKRDLPESLFLHIIRDGRDIALSLKKMGGFRPLPWDRPGSRGLEATALYWEWMVRKGREHGKSIPADYMEVHYEELISNPRPTLERLGAFLDHDLDYERIQSAAMGRWRESNSSFREEAGGQPRDTVNRWKERLSEEQVASLESLIGKCLEEFGYPLTATEERRLPRWQARCTRAFHFRLLSAKLWLKIHTPAGRLTNLSTLDLADELPSKAICEAN
ncbi:MAG TPA: sulfotransferase, partial [Terriglobales bacterium]|nr:sulfotransferase [Terriglobales bacterium]